MSFIIATRIFRGLRRNLAVFALSLTDEVVGRKPFKKVGIFFEYFERYSWFYDQMAHELYKLHGKTKHRVVDKMRRTIRSGGLGVTRCLCAPMTCVTGTMLIWWKAAGVNIRPHHLISTSL